MTKEERIQKYAELETELEGVYNERHRLDLKEDDLEEQQNKLRVEAACEILGAPAGEPFEVIDQNGVVSKMRIIGVSARVWAINRYGDWPDHTGVSCKVVKMAKSGLREVDRPNYVYIYPKGDGPETMFIGAKYYIVK